MKRAVIKLWACELTFNEATHIMLHMGIPLMVYLAEELHLNVR